MQIVNLLQLQSLCKSLNRQNCDLASEHHQYPFNLTQGPKPALDAYLNGSAKHLCSLLDPGNIPGCFTKRVGRLGGKKMIIKKNYCRNWTVWRLKPKKSNSKSHIVQPKHPNSLCAPVHRQRKVFIGTERRSMTLSVNQGIKTFCFLGQCWPGRDWQTSVSCRETEMAIGRMRIFRMVCEKCCRRPC